MRVTSLSSARPTRPAALPARPAAAAPAAAGAPRALSVLGAKAGPSGVVLPAVLSARDWQPRSQGLSGTQANAIVTKAYGDVDQAFTGYLGEPALPNWPTFGKYASRQVGGQIERLESVLYNLHNLKPDAMLNAMQDFARQPEQLGEQGIALMKLSRTPSELIRNVQRLRDALVYGNTGVYSNIAPAFVIFMNADAAGQDPLAALKRAGYGAAPLDPQNFLLRAFTDYKQAHEIAQNLAQNGKTLSAEDKSRLLDKRKALINEADLLIGIQEQMVILQRGEVFGDPEVSRLISEMTPKMTMSDALGTFPLLPNGGNWADFADRMGFVEVLKGTDPNAWTITGQDGVARDYIPNPDVAKRQGSIYQYFADEMDYAKAKTLIQSSPPPLPPSYSQANGWLTRLTGWLHKPLDWVAGLFHHAKPAPSA